MEPEPRKMQAERPVLLQDLSQSRLLLKFKQEKAASESNAAGNNNNTTATTSTTETTSTSNKTVEATPPPPSTVPIVTLPTSTASSAAVPPTSSSSKSINEDRTSTSTESPKVNSTKVSMPSSRKDSVQSKTTIIKAATPTPTLSGGGIYGEDFYDGGGVYGADLANVTSPPQPIVITKITARRPSTKDGSSEEKRTPLDTAKTSRKQSKDVDLERAYLISAAHECHNEPIIEHQQPEQAISNNTKAKTTKFNLNELQIDEEKLLKKESDENNQLQPNNRHHHHHHQHQQQQAVNSGSTPGVNISTPRKPAFNPLHVILKDKNKYHTTEYI